MARSQMVVLALAALLTTTNAFIPAQANRHNEFVPRTADPRELMPIEAHLRDLGKRQATRTSSTSVATWTIAPGSTCGYLSGSPGNAITCEKDRTCQWNAPVGVLCFDATTAEGYVTCLPQTRAQDPEVCDDVCQSNSFYLLCTASSAPYCRTYAYPSGLRDFRCVSESQSRISSVDWTYRGQDDPGFTTTVYADSTTSTAPADRTTTNPPNDVSSTTTAPAETSTEPASSGGGSKTPVGPIVGGVVGGVAVIGLIVLAAIYLIRRKRKPQQEQPAAAIPPPVQPQSPPPMMDQKPPYVGSPVPSTVQSPSVQSPVQSDWRGSSIISPQSTGNHHFSAELSAQPPGYSNSVHELSGNPEHTR